MFVCVCVCAVPILILHIRPKKTPVCMEDSLESTPHRADSLFNSFNFGPHRVFLQSPPLDMQPVLGWV